MSRLKVALLSGKPVHVLPPGTQESNGVMSRRQNDGELLARSDGMAIDGEYAPLPIVREGTVTSFQKQGSRWRPCNGGPIWRMRASTDGQQGNDYQHPALHRAPTSQSSPMTAPGRKRT